MKRFLVSAAVGIVGAAHAGAAAAQARPAEASVEEIVVTAQRREQAAQDVGIALSVLGGDDLAQRGITNVNQLQTATPSLDIEPAFGSGAAQFRLRGVGFQDYATNNTPTVGVYVNEVAYPIPVMTQGLIFDVQRVEVLRGPQGTLYGRNTTGGAINFITGMPTAEVAAGASVEFGRFEALKAEGYISGPISESIRGRLSFGTEQGGAWQHNRETGDSLGDADKVAARAMLDIDVTPNLGVMLDVHAGIDKSENIGLYLTEPFSTRFGAGPTIPADTDTTGTGWSISPGLVADTRLEVDSKPGRDNKTWGASANASWDLGAVKLTNIAAYDYLHREEYGDYDASSSIAADVFFGSKVKVWSDELRLASNTEGPLQWVAGVYVSRQVLRERYYSDFLDNYGLTARVRYTQEVTSASVFGQAEYAFNDQWKLIGGLRYEEETRELQDFTSAFGGATALPESSVETDMNPTTGKIALEYKPMADVLIYASASKGVKSGGFTTYNTANRAAIAAFKPETLYAYEVGFKTNPTAALQFNGAAFFYDYRDQQVLSARLTANGLVGSFVNAPKSEIWGGELELVWAPTAGLTISQSASYKDGEFKEFRDLDVPATRAAGVEVYIDKSGQEIPFGKWTYGGSVAYTADVGDFVVRSELNYSWRDDQVSWLGEKYDIPAYWLANASIGVTPADGPWGASIWVRNLFDEEYDLTRNFFTEAEVGQRGTPRTYGVRLTYAY
ncbi:MAG: TonB-dependent receptor [Phenylobacterium sp.]|uniref:TonB-dependent receptor n=1 Tax=Phenylobacterium sp. TaxID=1871053 RepID=UPI00391D6614